MFALFWRDVGIRQSEESDFQEVRISYHVTQRTDQLPLNSVCIVSHKIRELPAGGYKDELKAFKDACIALPKSMKRIALKMHMITTHLDRS